MVSASPQPSSGRSKKPIIAIAGVIGVVAVLGIALVLMFGFRPSPSEVVQEFVDLQNEGEYIEMLEQMTEANAQQFRDKNWDGADEPTQEWLDLFGEEELKFEIKDESIDGDKATVTGESIIDSEEPGKVKLYLVWEDGQWLIDDTKSELEETVTQHRLCHLYGGNPSHGRSNQAHSRLPWSMRTAGECHV